MTKIQVCGFETGDALEGAITGTASVQGTTKRSGSYALQANPTTTAVGSFQLQGFNASTGSIGGGISGIAAYVRFYFRYGTKPASGSEEIFVAVAATDNVSFAIRIDSSGFLSAYSNNTTQIGSTGTTALAADTWYRIDAKHITGAWAVRINGAVEISGSDTGPWAASSWRFGKATDRNGNTVNFYYDDICIDTTSYPADGQVAVMVPDANGTYQTFSIGAGSGSHYEVVDEIPINDDTDYLLSTGSVGDAETQALQSAASAGISGTVAVVKSYIRVKRVSAATSIKARFRSGSTNEDNGSQFNTAASYTNCQHILETDPNTGSAWTVSGLDGIEVGMIENTTTDQTRVTSMLAMVDFQPSAPAGTAVQDMIGCGLIPFPR